MSLKIKMTIAGREVEFDNFEAVAAHYERLADEAMTKAMSELTIKEQRFHEGKFIAFSQVASFLKTARLS